MTLTLEDACESHNRVALKFTSRFQILSEQSWDVFFIPIHYEQTRIYHLYSTLFHPYITH